VKSPEPPDDLSASSRALWPGLVADLAVAAMASSRATTAAAHVDLLLLADVLRARDRLDDIAAQIGKDGVTVNGSQGQIRPHPLLAVERALRAEVATGFERLELAPKSRPLAVKVGTGGRLQRAYGGGLEVD
jgi:hypothetical protein